ncbi:sporulation protein YjcZ [Cohnella xylanilytica]|nr:sporulation protein YjcZ [Cohnella xylanilytica]
MSQAAGYGNAGVTNLIVLVLFILLVIVLRAG